MSCSLFHGPGARDAAIAEASRIGREVHPPMGDEGLKVEDAREAVLILSSPAVGDDHGVLLIGPMDQANSRASDVLLKSIEEHRGMDVVPVLWAWDLAEVSLTIRSRCIPHWSPGEMAELPAETLEVAWQVCDAVLEGDLHRIISGVQEGKTDLEMLGRCLAHYIAVSAMEGQREFLCVWDAIRPQLQYTVLSPVGISHALLHAAQGKTRGGA